MSKKKKIVFESRDCLSRVLRDFHLWIRDQSWGTPEGYWDKIDFFIDNFDKPGCHCRSRRNE